MKDTMSLPALPTIDVDPIADIARHSDTRRLVRIAAWVIGAGFGGFLLWAAIAPLDEGVPTSGVVSVESKRKAVQHLQGGIVKEVLVHEGKMVEANQVVMRLDDAVARANYESTRQRYLALRAAEGRVLAEQLGLPAINFHPDLVAAAKIDPLIQQHMTVQTQLLQSRRASLAASLGALDESIKGQQGLIDGYRNVIVSRAGQKALLERELKGVRDLVAEGYAPLTKQMELERALADNAATTADLNANINRAQSAILELRQRSEVLRSDYRKEGDTQLADIRREVQTESEKFKAVSEDLARTEIRAPATGQVVGLAVQTVGGVVSPGQKLMDIVPEHETLVLETQVQPNLIDRVGPGAPVDVRFSTFAHSPQLVVGGIVDSISADILTDASSKYPYYLARVSITPDGMKTLGARQLQPGMPVEIVIKTGERSMLTYLLHPLLKRMSASMKEQ
jgi:membrane fusion protein, protease secretion system